VTTPLLFCYSKLSQRWSTSGFFWDGFLLIAIRWRYTFISIEFIYWLFYYGNVCQSIHRFFLFSWAWKMMASASIVASQFDSPRITWFMTFGTLQAVFFFVWLKFTSSVKYFRRSEEFVADIQGWWQETQLWSLRPAQGLSSPHHGGCKGNSVCRFWERSVCEWLVKWVVVNPNWGFRVS